MQGLKNQLNADKAQNDTEAVAQVHELSEERVHQEEQLSQAHECKHIARKHQECLRGDAKDRGNRVEGKHEVGRAQGQHHDEQRGQVRASAVTVQHAVADKAVRDGQDSAYDADEGVLLVLLLVAATGRGLLDLRESSPQQPHAENEEHPGEARHQRGTQQNEHEAQQQCDDDAEEQRLLLVLSRHPERFQDQDEHEKVVHGQRPFHRPSRVELLGVQPPVRQPDSDAEDGRQPHVEQRPTSRLSSGRRMGITRMPEEIERDQTDGNEGQNAPRPRVNNHEYLLTIRPWNFTAAPRSTHVTRAVYWKPRGRPRP